MRDLKYQPNGIDSPRPGLELLMIAVYNAYLILAMFGIGLASSYADEIDNAFVLQSVVITIGVGFFVRLGVIYLFNKILSKKFESYQE